MTTLADRLRGVIADVRRSDTSRSPHPQAPGELDARDTDAHAAAAAVLEGDWREVNGHRFLVIDRSYSAGYRHGHMAVAEALPPWPQLPILGADGGSRLLFFDLETTGLAGGAGTYAFLVGCGWFEPPSPRDPAGQAACFRTRQYFLSSYAAERALLAAVADDAADAGALVTYNGKSFDVPLVETRCILHRLAAPFAGLPHVDMLHTARRLWRDDEGTDAAGCRLTALEASLCGHQREGDVPGFEIPSRYFHYVRSGDARPLAAVLEHNRLDLLALALLTAQAAQLLDEGPAAARTAREAFGLGRLYERAGRAGEAAASYERAEALPGDVAVHAEALRARAVLARRGRRYHDAAAAWRRVLELRRCPPAIAREASEALAVHHEHRARDLAEARRFAVQSLQFNASTTRQQAVRHRLARLDRKLGGPVAPLFEGGQPPAAVRREA